MGKLKAPKDTKPKNSAEIMMESLKQGGMPQDQIDKAIIALHQQIQNNTAKVVLIGQTAFVVNPKPDMSAQFTVFSIEPNEIPARIKALSNSIRQMGFRRMFTLSITPNSKQIAEQSGLPFTTTQTTMMKGKEMVPAYRYEVTL